MKYRFSIDLKDTGNLLTKVILDEPGIENFPVFKADNWSVYFIKPASPIMYGIMDLHDFIMVYLVFIVFFVTLMLFIILKESTIKENDEFKKFKQVRSLYNVKFNHNTTLETIWIVIPSLILLTIAVPSFILLYAMDIIPSHDFSIKVVGHQWYWSYEYIMDNFYISDTLTLQRWGREYIFGSSTILLPYAKSKLLYRYTFDSYMIPNDELKPSQTRLLETTNPLVIPIAHYASVTVTSTDVIHSFAVPSLGIKIDAVPGRLNTVSMYILELGRFYGQCSELCGVNHGFMPIEIYCVDLIGFSIYKAALASKIVSKDLEITELGVFEKYSRSLNLTKPKKIFASHFLVLNIEPKIKNNQYFKKFYMHTNDSKVIFNFKDLFLIYADKYCSSNFKMMKRVFLKRGLDIDFLLKFKVAYRTRTSINAEHKELIIAALKEKKHIQVHYFLTHFLLKDKLSFLDPSKLNKALFDVVNSRKKNERLVKYKLELRSDEFYHQMINLLRKRVDGYEKQ